MTPNSQTTMDIQPEKNPRKPSYPVLTAALAAMLAMPAAAADKPGAPAPKPPAKDDSGRTQRLRGKAPATMRSTPAGKEVPKQPRQQDDKPLPPQPLNGAPLPPKR